MSAIMRRHRLGAYLVGLLIVLGALEIGALAVEASSSPALRWYDAAAQIRVEQMAELDDVDVVFAGTSMAWQGFVPEVWTAHDTAGRRAYNAGMAGGIPEVMEPWLVDVVQPRLRPDVVIWGLSSLDFSASYGAENLERYLDALETRPGLLADVEQAVADISALVRFRNVLRDPSEWGADRGFAAATAILGNDGERRDFVVDTSPERQLQVATRVADFRLDAADIAAVHRTVTKLRRSGTDVMFVQLPVPERFVELHPDGPSDVAATRGAIDRLGEILDVTVVDATGGFSDSDFVDFTHLDEASAARLTEQIAQDITGVDVTAAAAVAAQTTDTELLSVANELVAVADQLRSTLTQTDSMPASSEVWNSMVEYGHTRDLWAHHDQGTNFHTIFTGSSLVYAGIDPARYEELTDLSGYNMGLPAGGPEEVGEFLRDIALRTMTPERIILGVAPHDYWTRSAGPSCADQLNGYKSALQVRLNAFASVDWFQDVPSEQLILGDPVVHDPPRATPMHEDYRRVYSLLGDRSFYPKLGRKVLAERPAVIAERLSDFVYCPERFETFVTLVGELTAAGYETIVVAMPLSSYRVDPLPGGQAWVDEIMAETETAVLAAGATQYIDLKDILDDDRFYDLTHADFEGSQLITDALVAELATADEG